jgi:hypothetical protein
MVYSTFFLATLSGCATENTRYEEVINQTKANTEEILKTPEKKENIEPAKKQEKTEIGIKKFSKKISSIK